MSEQEPRIPSERRSEKVMENISRIVVSLMWAVLFAVILVVAYLASKFF